jgi:hypothetical protein
VTFIGGLVGIGVAQAFNTKAATNGRKGLDMTRGGVGLIRIRRIETRFLHHGEQCFEPDVQRI